MYTLQEIASIIQAEWPPESNNPEIEYLLTDSRRLVFPSHSLFFALPGLGQGGVAYIDELYVNGVRSFVVPPFFVPAKAYNGAVFLKVENVLDALQQIAGFHRQAYSIPVFGITGSNGKTVVKEWLNQLLAPWYEIVRSPKSFNSQVGVPLSIWQMNTAHTLGLFEAGISQPGEMQRLQKIIQPTHGIFTFIGQAHAEGFESTEEKIAEKLRLFSNSQWLFYCADEEQVHEGVEQLIIRENKHLQTFTWSRYKPANVKLIKATQENGLGKLLVEFDGQPYSFFIPFHDEASIHNALTCLCVLFYLKIPIASISEGLKMLRGVAMRLEMKQGINNCSIINDSYSADIDSLNIALDFLQQQEQHNKRTVVLSDFFQSGMQEELLYKKIADLLRQKQLYRLIGVGETIVRFADLFIGIPHVHFYGSTEALLQQLPLLHLQNETILLKGARIFRFEKISRALEQKMHETFLEIDLQALRHNYKVYRQMLQPGVQLMAMVKALSYGSGSSEVAGLLQHAGVDYLGVAYSDEGVELRKAGILKPIMVMNTEEAGFDNIVQFNLEPEIYSFNILRLFKNYLSQHGFKQYKVHIKLDTGMHRLGFEERDLAQLIQELTADDCLLVQSVFSHLAASDEAAFDDFTNLQFSLFVRMAGNIEAAVGKPVMKHIANTSGISRHKNMQLDMVRLGIGLYGIDSTDLLQKQLQNVTTLKTTISQLRKVSAGESVGYGRKGMLEQDAVIATVRIGYADGYFRDFGNGQGKMLVKGKLAPVVGTVCMDMTMIDVTGIDCAEEDEVIVFGEYLPVTTLAKWAKTIPYEILTSISQRVKRVYFEG